MVYKSVGNLKILYIILTAIMLVSISGCTKKDVTVYNYYYEGENELWSARFEYNGVVSFAETDGKLDHEIDSNETLSVTYKEDMSELSSVKSFSLGYQAASGGGSYTGEFDEERPLTEKDFTLKSSGSNLQIKDQVITVEIIVDGEKQVLELENVEE